jgi:hypothetical protein
MNVLEEKGLNRIINDVLALEQILNSRHVLFRDLFFRAFNDLIDVLNVFVFFR